MPIPVATVVCRGEQLNPRAELLEIEIRRELNRIPEARLVLRDWVPGPGELPLSDSGVLDPGAPVSIALRYAGAAGDRGQDKTLFKGLVVRHRLEARADGTVLRIDLKDAAFRLTRERKSAVFRNRRDDQVIGDLIRQAGVAVGRLATGCQVHRELVQYYASDWDFIVSRADVQALVVDCHLGQVSLSPIYLSVPPRRQLRLGMDQDLRELELEIDGAGQWAGIGALGWDLPQTQIRGPEQASDPAVAVGDLDADKIAAIARTLGGETYTLFHPVPMEQAELKAWADARLLRSRLALLRGRALLAGDAALAPLDMVTIERVGKHFNTKAMVSGVVHRVEHSDWTTELQFGLSPEWYARRPDLAEVPAGGLLPPVSGLQIAKIAAFESDPLGEHRIKVELPALDSARETVWARVLHPDAGKDRGFVFWPEQGDEVVVGFLDADPRQAVVLGALYGSRQTPPAAVGAPTNSNPKRAIVSRNGALVSFDDEHNRITIATPGERQIRLDDEAGQVVISDQKGNQVVLSDQGIVIRSAADLTIEAAGKVVIKGQTVDIQ